MQIQQIPGFDGLPHVAILTMLMYGYLSTSDLSKAISCARLCFQTSRIRDLTAPAFESKANRPSCPWCNCCCCICAPRANPICAAWLANPVPPPSAPAPANPATDIPFATPALPNVKGLILVFGLPAKPGWLPSEGGGRPLLADWAWAGC